MYSVAYKLIAKKEREIKSLEKMAYIGKITWGECGRRVDILNAQIKKLRF